jgi:hypothetical protein
MIVRSMLLAAATLAAPSLAGADTFSDRDSLLVDAAAVPQAGTLRLSAGGGASASTAASSSASANLGAGIQYTLLPGFALGVSGYVDGGQVTPAATARYQFLNQLDHGLNLSALARFKSVGFTSTGSELEAGVNAGRRFGLFDVLANGVVGKGLGGDSGTDLEGKLSTGVALGQSGRLGLDARLRSEISDSQQSITPPMGRDFDLMAGPTASVIIQRVQLQAFAGYSAPRHTVRAGPAALGSVSIDF